MQNQEPNPKNDLSSIDEKDEEINTENDLKKVGNDHQIKRNPLKRSLTTRLSYKEKHSVMHDPLPIIELINKKTSLKSASVEKSKKVNDENKEILSSRVIFSDEKLDHQYDEFNNNQPNDSPKFASESKRDDLDFSPILGLNTSQIQNIDEISQLENQKEPLKGNDMPLEVKKISFVGKKSREGDSKHSTQRKFVNLRIAKDNVRYSVKELGDQIREAMNTKNISSLETLRARTNILDEDTFEPLEETNNDGEIKDLDRWQHENREKKLIRLYGQKDDIYQQVHYLKNNEKGKEFRHLIDPKINHKLLNYILEADFGKLYHPTDNSKSEILMKKFLKKNEMMNFSNNNDESDLTTNREKNNERKPLQGLENLKRELNIEIINELIIRKIKQIIPSFDNIELASDDVKIKIKSITDKVLGHFTSLKGFSSANILNYHVEHLIKNCKQQKKVDDEGFLKKLNNASDNSDNTLDYITVEGILKRKYEDATAFIQELRQKLKDKMQASMTIKNQIKEYRREKDEKSQYFDNDEQQVLKNMQLVKMTGKRASGAASGIIDEQMNLFKIRLDKKKMEQEISEKSKKAEENLSQITEIIAKIEEDLATCKNKKNVFKIQLRDLYHKILKDDNEVLKKDNEINYVWVLKSLWNLNEEVKIALLPSFLERESAEYIIEFGKAQYDLEKYCKDNNLAGILSLLSDVTLNNQKSHNDYNHHIQDLRSTESYTKIGTLHFKDYQELLYETKEKLVRLKKQNCVIKNDLAEKSKLITLEDESKIFYDDGSRIANLGTNSNILKQGVNSDNSKVDKATLMLTKAENLKKTEIKRLNKSFSLKRLDERLQIQFQKITRFLFGKKEGEEIFNKFMKEKRIYDQKLKNVTRISTENTKNQKLFNQIQKIAVFSASKSGLTGLNDFKDIGLENSFNNQSRSLIKAPSNTDLRSNAMYLPQIRDKTPQPDTSRSLSLNIGRASATKSQFLQYDNQLPKLYA